MEGDVAAMIPPQLCTPEFRFNLVQAKDKRAIEKAWNTEANYKFDHARLQEHLARGGNYGVLTGFNDLAVLDADTPELRAWVEQHLPLTFTVKTSKGAHFYYRIPSLQKKIIFTKNKEHFGELQFKGQYVVGPTCTHSSGAIYEIIADEGIAELSELRLAELTKEWTEQAAPAPQKQEAPKNKRRRKSTVELIKERVNLSEVLGYYGVNTAHSPTNCPLHADDKPSFSFDNQKGLWKCHTEGIGGDVVRLVELKENCDFKQALSILAERYGIETPEMRAQQFTVQEPERFEYRGELTSQQREMVSQLKNEALQWLADNKPNYATECIVNAFRMTHKILTIRDDKGNSEVYIYNEGVYLPSGISYIKQFTRNVLGRAYVQKLLSEVVLKITTDTYIDPEDFFDSAPLQYLPLVDCIYDIESDRTIPFDHNIIFLRKLPVKHNPSADCPHIKAFLKEILSTDEDLNTMQEVFGYFLYREYWLEKSIMFLGKGSNGKTVLLELMHAFLGTHNVSSISLAEIEKDQYAVANLLSKLANIAGDIGNAPIEDSQMFKKLTGRDPLTANRKHLPHVEFKNYAKLVFSCNDLPDSFDDSDGFWRRWIFFNFKKKFVSQREYDQLDEIDKQQHGVADPFILQKLTTPEELDGLFVWALDGLKRLRNNRSFSDKRSARELRDVWKRKANSFYAFLEDEVEVAIGRCIRETNLMARYSAYCRENDLAPTSEKSMKYQLRKYGANYERKLLNPPSDTPYERDYFWSGIVFKRDSRQGIESVYKQKEVFQTAISESLPVLPALPSEIVKDSHVGVLEIKSQNAGKTGKTGISPYNAEIRGVKSEESVEERWTMGRFVYKCLRGLHKKSGEPVPFEHLLTTTREQANMMGVFRMSSDIFESQFEDALNVLKQNGEIAETQPARYVPL